MKILLLFIALCLAQGVIFVNQASADKFIFICKGFPTVTNVELCVGPTSCTSWAFVQRMKELTVTNPSNNWTIAKIHISNGQTFSVKRVF